MGKPRVLVVARTFPNSQFPTLGVYTQRLVDASALVASPVVIAGVPYVPPGILWGHLRRFRAVEREQRRGAYMVSHPRILVGPGQLVHDFDARLAYPAIRKAAVRMTEPYLKKNDAMVETLAALKSDPVADVRMQLIFSLAYSESPKAKALAGDIVRNANGAEVLARAQRSVEKNEDAKKFGMKLGRLDAPDRALVMNGSVIYKSLCATCHGADGKGLMSKTAPPLAGSRRLSRNNTNASVQILLHGLSGPIEGNTYPTEMPSMKDNDDEWIASVLSYVRHEFTNSPPVRPADVKTIRDQTVSRDKAYTLDELSIQ